MKAGVLFSGGKDSALAAIMLARDYDVELNTFVFDPEREMPGVEAAAAALGLPLRKRIFGNDVLDEAVAMVLRCRYPNDAINMVHRRAIEDLCRDYTVVGDGTRWNDRVPMLARPEVQRIEALYRCSYIRPLLGYGKPEVERLAGRFLVVTYGETGTIENGDYEQELRSKVRSCGIDPATLFPEHHRQSLVIGITDRYKST
ncbi:arginosuccinate synthase [Methanoculleus taiwanensis]|uniref:Arginosuccinate synthase n=1 Tax=Methanoculleus taiwanensis TaxID=1550565 RepID=A0A498H362_9EURY|nr:alpha hydrolase [Methanoculleus taiwanensis]RXE57253.1 arginosuccinate synthase [Methanoculleus taiwanensis]